MFKILKNKKFSYLFGLNRGLFTTELALQKCSPLEGVRVLDLTRIVAGPYCTMLLGDLGAEVIKIEQPNMGDETRRYGPFFGKTNLSSYFVSLNRNKKSVCVNLKTEEGKNIIRDLAKTCDVFIENYIPGKLDSIGLGYEHLNKVAPQLVYCSLTGYGFKGPYKNRPGYDVIASSFGGLLHITGPADGDPCRPGVAMTDLATGLYAYGAIMTALLQKQKTGVGQRICCDLLSTQLSSLINIGSAYLNANKEATRWGTAHPSIVPYQSFPTADSFITVGAGSNGQFASLCKLLSLEELVTDDRFKTNHSRVENREILIRILKDKFSGKTTKEWLLILDGSPFPYGPVNSIEEVFNDIHVKEIGLVKELDVDDLDQDSTTKVKVVGPSVEFSRIDNKVRSPPPNLGQHTIDVLKRVLNYSDQQVLTLLKNGDVS